MYQQFAQVYDALMGEVDYEGWVEYIEKLFRYFKVEPESIIDLACGTGNITIPLGRKGYNMTGVDLSYDMLAVADQKANELSLKIQWMCQNMKDFQGFKEKDAIICACDGMNYILKEEELQEIFSRVYHSLGGEGLFAFDMNSQYKITEVLADQTFAYAGEEISYIWENDYNEENGIIDFELSFFVKKKDKYERFNEIHQQKVYSTEKIIELLKNVGFKKVVSLEAFTLEKPRFSSERIQYVAQK